MRWFCIIVAVTTTNNNLALLPKVYTLAYAVKITHTQLRVSRSIQIYFSTNCNNSFRNEICYFQQQIQFLKLIVSTGACIIFTIVLNKDKCILNTTTCV